MKKTIVSLLLLFSMVFSVFALSACGNGKKDETAEPTQQQTTALTTDKWEVIAPEVKALPEDARSFKIELDAYSSSSKTARNDVYLKGPDFVDVETPDIDVMIYNRNRAAADLLGVSIEYTTTNLGWNYQSPWINTQVQAQADDAPDLFVNMLYDLNQSLLKSCFKDVWSIPGSYFDFKADGWLDSWMENMSFTGDRAYILGGDYFMDIFRVMTLLPFNMSLMDANSTKLIPAVLGEGEALSPGEKLSSRFYDLVERGDWTWEVLGKLCEAIWEDRGDKNRGQDSIEDLLGIIADENQGFSAGGFVYSCGEELIVEVQVPDKNDPTVTRQWLRYAPDSSGLNRIFDEVKKVFEGNGSFSNNYSPSGNTLEKPGQAYHHTKFAKSELLFCSVCLLGGLEDSVFQNMTDIFSVVPCPKADVSGTYNTIIYNTGDAGAINVHTDPEKTRALTAYLQYCTENSDEIRDKYLQVVTKYETTTYNQGTDRMLDLIYDTILYGRDKTVDDLVFAAEGSQRWHSMMKINNFMVGSDYISSEYKSLVASKQRALDDLMETWYKLPKVEPEAE